MAKTILQGSVNDRNISKKRRKTDDEMGRQHQRIDRDGVWRFPEGSGRQGKVKRYYCIIICSSRAVKVKGL